MAVVMTTLMIFGVATAVLYLRKVPPFKAVLGGLGLAVAFVLPHLWFTQQPFGYLPLFTVVLCAVYALFALGLNVVVGFAGLLDLGYVAFFLFGAYVGAWFMSDFSVNVSSGTRNMSFHFLSAAESQDPRHPHVVLPRHHHRRHGRRPCRCHHRRPNSAVEERLPRAGHPGLRRDPSRGLPQR